MEVIVVVIVVLTVVTLVGHGIWSLLAWLVRGLSDAGTMEEQTVPRCGFCGNRVAMGMWCCPHCKLDLRSPLARQLGELKTMDVALRRLQAGERLPPAEMQKLVALMQAQFQAYRAKLLESQAVGPSQSPAEPIAPAEPAVIEASLAPEPSQPIPAAPRAWPPAPPQPAVQPVAVVAAAPEPARPAPVAVVPPPAQPVEPAAPPAPRKSLSEILAEFMQPHNIRWGEVIGGLLFVIGAAALVITQWETLQQFRYFRFFLFMGVTAAMFALGLYSHYRWKLEATSRALLSIAVLLVPLNFLTMAGNFGFSGDDSLVLTLALEAGSLAVFGALVYLAGRVLVPGGRWLHVLAVLGVSAVVLVVARRFDPDMSGWLFSALGCLPVAIFAAALAGYLLRLLRHDWLSPTRVVGLFNLLGTGAFALAVALGLLTYQAARLPELDLRLVLGRLAIPVALAALPGLVAGLAVMRRVRPAAALEPLRTAGIWIALVAMLVMLATLAMAWPQPGLIIAVGVLNGAALAAAAIAFRVPLLHAGTVACATLAYLSAYHLSTGPLGSVPRDLLNTKMLQLAVSAESGTALVGLFALLAVVSEVLARRGRLRDGLVYAAGSGAIALAGLSLVTIHALRGDPTAIVLAALVYGLYGIGSLVLNARLGRPLLSYLGLGLLLGAQGWTLWHATGRIDPTWAAAIAVVALALGALATLLDRLWPGDGGEGQHAHLIATYRIPLWHMAELTAAAALTLGVATAWIDAATIDHSLVPVLTAVCLVAAYLLLAWTQRSPERTGIAATVALLGLVHTLALNYSGEVARPWSVALLAHATLTGLSGVLAGYAVANPRAFRKGTVPFARNENRDRPPRHPVTAVFVEPLLGAALFASLLALPASLVLPWDPRAMVAATLVWLAAIWLGLAWWNRWPALLSAHQAVLALAVPVAISAVLQRCVTAGYVVTDRARLYGLGLGVLVLVWAGLRIALGSSRTAQRLINPRWGGVDRLLKHALVVLQLLVIVPGVLGPALAELRAAGLASLVQSYALPPALVQGVGLGAWGLLVLLAIVLVVSLWDRWGPAELGDALVLAVSVPCLAAGPFVGQAAAAAALRWTLALGFLACSLAIWQRDWLWHAARQVQARVRVGLWGPRIARSMAVTLCALPVLGLTILAALSQFVGPGPVRPVAGFFAQISSSTSYLVPLALVLVGLVGTAVRERSAGYAFSGGLVAELMVVLGYPLYLVTRGHPFGSFEFVTLIQLFAITAAVWAIGWLVARRRIDVWREAPAASGACALMRLQLGMATLGNGLSLAIALVLLALVDRDNPVWIGAAGSPLGWAALLLLAAAAIYRLVQLGRPLPPSAAGLLGMSAMGLLACTVQAYWPEWGYRTLMLGWACYALLIVLVTWWVAAVRTTAEAVGPSQALTRLAAVWVRAAGIAAVLLGLKAAVWHQEQLWAAAAIAVAAAAGAAMALWRRREGWAFAAALGVNLAASLVVWHFHHDLWLEHWWIALVQANVIAGAAAALLWLAARRRLVQLGGPATHRDVLLRLQVLGPVLGNVLLGIVFVCWVIGMPRDFVQHAAQLAGVPGWLALLLTAAAVAWYLVQVAPRYLFQVLGGLTQGLVLLVAGSQAVAGARYDYLHTLIAGTALACVLALAAGWLGRRLRLRPTGVGQDEARRPAERIFLGRHVRDWTTALGGLAVAFAVLWSSGDPQRPWWTAGAVVVVLMASGLLALWQRLPAYVYLSGLLVCVAGSLAGQAWGPQTPLAFIEVNVLCLALGACGWSLVDRFLPGGAPTPVVEDRRWPFAHVAGQAVVAILAPIVLTALLGDLFPRALDRSLYAGLGERLSWAMLGVAATAMALGLWDRTARYSWIGLYAVALAAVGVALHAPALPPRAICWAGALAGGGFVLAAAALARVLPALTPIARRVGISCEPERWWPGWFAPSQATLMGTVAALAAWIAVDSTFQANVPAAIDAVLGRPWLASHAGLVRTAGPAAALLLVPAAVLMAGSAALRWRAVWQQAALGAGVLVLAATGWAGLPANMAAPWLHRSVILMLSAAIVTLTAAAALRWLVPPPSDWRPALARGSVWLATLTAAALAAVLIEEPFLYQPPRGTPLAWPGIAVVAATLLGLAAACIGLAVMRGPDPLRLTGRGRTAYVYAAEVLLLLAGIHLRLCKPRLFELGIIEHYGLLLVLLGAFCGAALSEFFRRRRLPVLSEPLEWTAIVLPAVPMVMYWTHAIGPRVPAVWFLIGLFYATLGLLRRSFWLGLLAVLAGNTGLWLLWHQWHLGILSHPQLWLIPLALAGLVAEYVNHQRLPRQQSAGLRYLMLAIIYVSSSADMFIAGIGNSVLLPLVLLGLSVLGILVGMALRVRAFLYLGVVFLLVVLVTMLKYVTIDLNQTWVLWVCVIALGAAILALFAVFEKRRNDIMAAMKRFRGWE